MPELKAVLVGSLAAVLAWPVNRFFLPKWRFNISLWGPLWEEGLKTGLALAWGGSLFFAHFTFGLIEGAWEWSWGRKGAAWAAIGGHTLFGLAAVLAWWASNSPFWAWGAGALLHIGWNLFLYFLHRQFPSP
ncbi:hypothetical protein SAMN00808754_0159 [Thermanaeromonas toyohensis ToBE]|uniref:CAAX protease self-immunity n=1 Tax=Thermanaeromonas toyohensis ToBE TaxID=698762 RepID=A0A1W1V7Y5_9FIRM|nr:hypothetical protein [Thermanaeromonas toyohensis]SMB89468.1 hypothetical protein SAMN00808754_0159 [Thermanaeromonas toyohensis ToBE]